MADLNVTNASSSPLAIHGHVRPPEPKKVQPDAQNIQVDTGHGPAVVLGGSFAKPPVKPSSGAQGTDNKPNPFTPPKPGSDKTDGPGQHFNHVI